MKARLLRLKHVNNVEYWNVITHGGAFLLSIFMLILFTQIEVTAIPFARISVLVYALSMCLAYLASTLYHYFWDKSIMPTLRKIDHMCIYYLIAGSYTPFMVILFGEATGYKILTIIWTIAVIGTVFKLFFTGKYELLSLILYVAMGLTILLEYRMFLEETPILTLVLITLGGISYLIGAVIFAKEAFKYHHVVWHLFVIGGNLFHLMAVLTIL